MTAALTATDIKALDVSRNLCAGVVGQGSINRDVPQCNMFAVADGEAMDWGVQDVDAFDDGVCDTFNAHGLWLLNSFVSSTTVPVILTMTVDNAVLKTDNSAVCG